MDNQKLREIIAQKNERLEERAVDRAHEIINEIAKCQEAKRAADIEIEKLRTELKTLTAQQIDETSILGS